ncbi:MAG: hypothetical protein F6K10_27995 [Moorea sp. SIO2B7]|nr:hypothetical protein [Moorena sp. SIO2B7]
MAKINIKEISPAGLELFIAPEGLINELIDDDLGKIMGREYLSAHNYLSPKCAIPTD